MSTQDKKNNSVGIVERKYSTDKLSFQSRMQKLQEIQEVLQRADEPFEISGSPRAPHCLHCQRTGFCDEGAVVS